MGSIALHCLHFVHLKYVIWFQHVLGLLVSRILARWILFFGDKTENFKNENW